MRARALALLGAAAAVAAAPLTAEVQHFLSRTALRFCEMEPRVGAVESCNCDFEVVDEATRDVFGPLLRNLTQKRFFRYFKVDLDRECPFWPDDGVCARESCAVGRCEDEEVPAPWLQEDRNRTDAAPPRPAFMCDAGDLGAVARSEEEESGGWAETGGDEVWIVQPEDERGMAYVDLLRNPEGFTGYDGEPARRVWRAVYEENCFDLETPAPPKEQLVLAWRAQKAAPHEPSGQCLERRVFYKLISGLQASISTHIAASPFTFWEVVMSAPATLKRRAAALVGAAAARCAADDAVCLARANDALFLDRVGGHKDRLHNLYFAYLFVLRAVAVAGPQLEHYYIDTGDRADDAEARQLLRALVAAEPAPFPFEAQEANDCAAASAARAAFDETALFKAPEAPGMSPLERALARESVEELRAQFVQRFRNVSTIMDCVACEKCRLWGKLQVLGLGTALKILLMEGDESGTGVLQRNEVVALVNTLAQLARSVDSIRDWQRRDVRKAYYQLAASAVVGAGGLAAVLVAGLAALRRARATKDP